MPDERPKCPNCGFVNSTAAVYCINCGSGMTEPPWGQRKSPDEILTVREPQP